MDYSKALDRTILLKEELAALFEPYTTFTMACEEI
jgi:hypothetical protein